MSATKYCHFTFVEKQLQTLVESVAQRQKLDPSEYLDGERSAFEFSLTLVKFAKERAAKSEAV